MCLALSPGSSHGLHVGTLHHVATHVVAHHVSTHHVSGHHVSAHHGGVHLGGLGLLGLESLGVGTGDAQEVGEEEAEAGGNVELPDDELALGLLHVAGVGGASVDGVVAVPEVEVDSVPGAKENHRDNGKLASNPEATAGVIGLL